MNRVPKPLPDAKTMKRALRLRDSALAIRDLAAGFQAESRIMAVQSAGFQISYREPPSALRLGKKPSSTQKLVGRSAAVTIARAGKLLEVEWDGADVRLKLFRRGDWENAFLRGARSPLRTAAGPLRKRRGRTPRGEVY